jgi:ProP effector
VGSLWAAGWRLDQEHGDNRGLTFCCRPTVPENLPSPDQDPMVEPALESALEPASETASKTASNTAPETEPAAAPAAAAPPVAAQERTAAPAPAPAVADLSPAACAARLSELFPAVFTLGAARPLKLRIQADIQQRAPGIFSKKSLSIFLHRHTTSTAYLRALVGSPQRVDLNGAPAGDVADEHRQAATTELERRRALHEERRAAERDAQRKMHEAQRKAFDETRRQHAADDDARRERSALLQAFEATTLTQSNFCALKGLSEAELDAALAQARLEPFPKQRQPSPGVGRRHR